MISTNNKIQHVGSKDHGKIIQRYHKKHKLGTSVTIIMEVI